MEIVEVAFTENKPRTKTQKNSLERKNIVVNCSVIPNLLNDKGGWTITSEMKTRLGTKQKQFYKRMLKIPWREYVTLLKTLAFLCLANGDQGLFIVM